MMSAEQSIPEGRLARAGIAGKAALKIGARQLSYQAKRPFLSKHAQDQAKDSTDDRNAEELFKALTQLRGTALKVAQMLSMEVELLPERYCKELEKSFHQVPPLNRVLVRKAIVEAFGKPPEELFATFDSTAFAAASLGQVHRATLHDGTAVAVKIQYPGIHVAMDSDLQLVQQLIKGLPHHNKHIILQSLDEIQERLREAVTYHLEADNTRWFHEHLQQPRINVPQVYAEWSSARVITTSFVQGKHLDDWLAANPSQELRDQTAQRLYDLMVHSIRELRCLHADPNPGNYLFHDDGGITLIDFGCIRRLSPTFVETLPQLMNAYYHDDPASLFPAYRNMGMNYSGEHDKTYQEILRPFGQWLAKTMQEEVFDFREHPDYTHQGKEAIQQLAKLADVDRLPGEFVFFDRTFYGLLKIAERMQARVRIRQHWIKEPINHENHN